MKVTVEVNISNGIGIHLVGLADVAVRESLLRTVTALQSMGIKVPGKKIVINLAPADIHKNGSGYDLPIALGIIAASRQLDLPLLEKYVIVGELGLDGTIREVPGALPISEMAIENGYAGCILPMGSAMETIGFEGGEVYGARTLKDVLAILCGKEDRAVFLVGNMACAGQKEETEFPDNDTIMDFSEIVGQDAAKRGLEIAASGGHSVILIGPPGGGKSSLAKAMIKILPPLSSKEALQTCKIYSVAGRGYVTRSRNMTRPFRAPHNTVSVPALLGGGSDNITPGEVSLAHNGILFLDEFCEIPKKTIDMLRGPMEDRRIIVSRLRSKVEYPADFTLVAATNPCPCGYYGDGDKCTCTIGQRHAYLAKLSGPIMDRIDMQLWVRPVRTSDLVHRTPAESSADVAARVIKARQIQNRRFESEEGVFCNAGMSSRMMKKYCRLDDECSAFLEKTAEKAGLSARAYGHIIRMARTIADLDGDEEISVKALAEAASYRCLDKAQLQF